MKELSVNGITLRYDVRGHGDPLILLHGNGEDHRIFRTELLEPHFSCYLIDSRGHGRSTRLHELHYREMAADILEFIRRLDLHDVTLAGFSDGGIIGLIAASQTDRIRTLIACGANASPDGLILPFRIINHVIYALTRSPLFRLMIEEPDIRDEELQHPAGGNGPHRLLHQGRARNHRKTRDAHKLCGPQQQAGGDDTPFRRNTALPGELKITKESFLIRG